MSTAPIVFEVFVERFWLYISQALLTLTLNLECAPKVASLRWHAVAGDLEDTGTELTIESCQGLAVGVDKASCAVTSRVSGQPCRPTRKMLQTEDRFTFLLTQYWRGVGNIPLVFKCWN